MDCLYPTPVVSLLSFFLVLIWGHCNLVTLRKWIDGENLRVLSWRTKTTHRGQAFGIIAQGLMSKKSFHWLHKYLLTLDAALNIWIISCQIFRINKALCFHYNQCRMLQPLNGFDTTRRCFPFTLVK